MKDYLWVIDCPLNKTTHDWTGMKQEIHEMVSPDGVPFHLIRMACKCGANIVIMKPESHLTVDALDLRSLRDGDFIR